MRRSMSLTKAATVFGIHRNTLAGWMDEGCPYVTKADRSRGIEWELDFPAVLDWRIERVVGEAVASAARSGEALSLEGAQRRRAVAMAITAEIDADEKLRSVLCREDAISDQKAFVAAVQAGVLSIVPEFARVAANLTNAAEIQDTFERLCNVGLATARAELARAWAQIDDPATATA